MLSATPHIAAEAAEIGEATPHAAAMRECAARFEVGIDAAPPLEVTFHGFHPPSIDTDLAHNEGIIATAIHCVNSVPYVVAAEPGILTYLDLPLMPGRGVQD